MIAIIDFDGTLTAEETQAADLAQRSLAELAQDILRVSETILTEQYAATRRRVLSEPYRHWWEVKGLVASYCDEGAFILNTTTIQAMLRSDPGYLRAVASAFPVAEYDAVVDCTNYLFHRHTAALAPAFRPSAGPILTRLVHDRHVSPMILTNSLGDKVTRHLGSLGLGRSVPVLGDTRQYDMDPAWGQRFEIPEVGLTQVWQISATRRIDLRRRVYYEALNKVREADPHLAVVADTLSLPGALPLAMGIPFVLLATSYTPEWCLKAVQNHPCGRVIDKLDELPGVLGAVRLG